MPNKIKLEEVEKRLPAFVRIIPESYKGIRYNATFLDIEYDEEFVGNVDSVIRLQHGCKTRTNKLRSLKNKGKCKGPKSLNEVKEGLPDFLIIDDDSYSGVRNKAKFYDKEYGVWFESYPANMIKGKGYCKERMSDMKKEAFCIPLEEVNKRIFEYCGDRYKMISNTYKAVNKTASFIRDDGVVVKYPPYMIYSGKVDMRKDLEKWKAKVLVRDDWKCWKCGKDDDSQAHHINPFSSHIEDRLDPENGATLCKKCHEDYHSLFKGEEKRETLEKFIKL